jgi:alpha-galactosidase
LDGRETTLVFAWSDGVPAAIYHGSRLEDGIDLNTIFKIHQRPLPQATLDINPPISLHPEPGQGFAGHPALIAHRPGSDRPAWAGRFTFAKSRNIRNGVIFELLDAGRGLELEIECVLDPTSDVMVSASRLTNIGDNPALVEWLSAPVVAPSQQFSHQLSFQGRWCGEFDVERLPVSIGQMRHENRRGRTSHESFPGVILLGAATDDQTGLCLAMHLGWSGNHRLLVERLPNGDIQVQMGALLFSGEGNLGPGETIQSPDLYCAHSARGLNDVSRKLHAHVRNNICKWPLADKPRPVSVNTWEAIYFDHNHERLTSLVDAAADIGAERFVLDDGWFEGRNDDSSSLGDWYADSRKFPKGLQPIADFVRSKSMEFGLWVEPEMVNRKSELFTNHPDWVLALDNYPLITGRNQLVLDVSNPDVSQYLYDRLEKLVGDHQIAYLKWDMNRELVLPGDAAGRPAAYQQVGALYQLMDRLLAKFPGLEIESCASGGGRVDYEILKRTHRFWTSDSNDSVERMRIQNGFSYFFPPEIMGAHIGPAWSHTSGRGLHTGFRALIASYGHMGIEADLTKMAEDDLAIIRAAVERYKQDRHIWHTGVFHRLRTVDENLVGCLGVLPDKSAARLVLAQLDRPRSTLSPRIHIPGLDPASNYEVMIQTVTERVAKANRTPGNSPLHSGMKMSGKALETIGIGLPCLYAQTGIAIAINEAS